MAEYKLTPLGSNVAMRTGTPKNAEEAIIVYLYEHSNEPVAVEELVAELNTTEQVVMHTIERLLNKESPYIKEL